MRTVLTNLIETLLSLGTLLVDTEFIWLGVLLLLGYRIEGTNYSVVQIPRVQDVVS